MAQVDPLPERVMGSTKQIARLAGLAYFVNGIASGLGLVCAPLVLEDATALADKIAASEPHFRIAIVSDLVAQVSCVFLVLLLYQLLKSVNQKQAALMVILVLVSVPIALMISLNDVAAQILLSGGEFLSAFTKPQRNALALLFVKLHIHGTFAVEIYWGLWLLPFGLLVFKSRFLPRILGVLLIIAGFAYVAHSLISLFLPGHRNPVYWWATMAARGAGELPIIFWLLIKGADLSPSLSAPPEPRT
jgi:hypothetical protein